MSAFSHACTCLLAALALTGCSTPPASRADSLPAATTSPPATQAADREPVSAESEPSDNPNPGAVEANNVYFQLRSTAVDEAEKLKLREHADRLKQNPKEKVTLIGHMDDLGSRNYNLAITEERLMAVNRQLRSFGVPARQIRRNRAASDSGSTPCRNEACRALMRRVELKYPE